MLSSSSALWAFSVLLNLWIYKWQTCFTEKKYSGFRDEHLDGNRNLNVVFKKNIVYDKKLFIYAEYITLFWGNLENWLYGLNVVYSFLCWVKKQLSTILYQLLFKYLNSCNNNFPKKWTFELIFDCRDKPQPKEKMMALFWLMNTSYLYTELFLVNVV